MINLITADFFRLKKNKINYVVLVAIFLLVFISIHQKKIIYALSPNDTYSEFYAKLAYYGNGTFTGMNALQIMANAATLLPFTLIPAFTILLINEMRKRVYVNILSKSQNRIQYFFAKLATLNIVTIFIYSYYFLLSFIIGSLLNGVGEVDTHVMLKIIYTIALQMLLQISWNTLCTAFLVATGLNGFVLAIYIGAPFLFTIFSNVIPTLSYFSLISLLDNVSFIPIIDMKQEALIISCITIIVSIVVGSLLFNRRNLK